MDYEHQNIAYRGTQFDRKQLNFPRGIKAMQGLQRKIPRCLQLYQCKRYERCHCNYVHKFSCTGLWPYRVWNKTYGLMNLLWTWPTGLLTYGPKTQATCVDLSWQFCVDSMAAMIGSRLLTGRVIMMWGMLSPPARYRGHVRQVYMLFIYHRINSCGVYMAHWTWSPLVPI